MVSPGQAAATSASRLAVIWRGSRVTSGGRMS